MASLLFLFIVFAALYVLMEVLWDGTTHRSMALAGGICGMIGTWILTFDLPYAVYMLLTSLVITIVEYSFGKWFNSDYSIWDYRDKPFNFQGQVCLTFVVVWAVVMPWLIKVVSELILYK